MVGEGGGVGADGGVGNVVGKEWGNEIACVGRSGRSGNGGG